MLKLKISRGRPESKSTQMSGIGSSLASNYQGTYEQFSQPDLLLYVQTVLKSYERGTK